MRNASVRLADLAAGTREAHHAILAALFRGQRQFYAVYLRRSVHSILPSVQRTANILCSTRPDPSARDNL
jgi:hypothetical protein